MPIRMLRDWTDSVTVAETSAEAERLFTRLIMKADDYGRFHADPRLVRALCFPLSESIKSDAVRKWMDELHRAGLVFRYEVDGKPFLAIVNFGQRLKNSRAKFPQMEGEEHDWAPTSGNFREVPGTSGNFREVAGSSGLNRIRKEYENEQENDADGPCRSRGIGPTGQPSDDEFLKELGSNPAFVGIDIAREFGKCRAWCVANKKQCSRRRFVNWLNRAERPIHANGAEVPAHKKY